eukprot:scaffold64811_cov16-Prasinocladus_malaysianus.AAC.1
MPVGPSNDINFGTRVPYCCTLAPLCTTRLRQGIRFSCLLRAPGHISHLCWPMLIGWHLCQRQGVDAFHTPSRFFCPATGPHVGSLGESG